MEWWGKMRGAWNKLAKRLGLKKTGLVKLRHDVRTCEYEDVRILWEMLKKNGETLETSVKGSRRKQPNRFVEWAKCAPLLCHHGV